LVTDGISGTLSWATQSATSVTVTDNESTNEGNALVFAADADLDGGVLGLESDGDATYNPSTGTIAATNFSGNLTGTLQTPAQGNVTSLGTLSALTVDNVITDGTTIGHTADADLMTLANGSVTFTGSTVIATADVNGGAIDAAAIGANSASTGAFTTVTASTSLDVTGSAGVILQNDETITNSSDGTVLITAPTTTVTGDLTVTGNDITFGNAETISNSSDGTLAITAPATTMSGTLTSTGALTASANLTVGNGASTAGSIVFNEDTDDGSNTLTLKPAAMAANVTLTLPVDDGTADQVLATDGSGVLSWATAGGTKLAQLTENSQTGWRFSTATAANHGDIGTEAVDLSYSASTSSTRGATGLSSFAMGEEVTASGARAIAIGEYAEATGNTSIALGYVAKATGDRAFATGNNTTASGSSSTSMGSETTASGSKSTATGYGTIASDYGSLVMGTYNSVGSSVTSGGSATAFDADNSAFVIGNGTNSSSKSDALVVYSSGNATLGGDLTVTGNDITFGNAETISNSSNGTIAITAPATTISGTLTVSGETDFGDAAITGYSASLQTLSGTSKTLAAADNGTIIVCSSSSAVTITVPVSLPSGFNCMIIQSGSGQVSLSASSTTLNNRNGSATAGQHAIMTLVHLGSNLFVVSGDTTS
jgi:hypothetical protein